MWGSNFHNSVVYLPTPFKNENLENVVGKNRSISVSNSGEQVWGIGNDSHVYYRGPYGVRSSWSKTQALAKVISVSPCGEYKAIVGSDDNIWIRKPPHYNWVKVTYLTYDNGNFDGDFRDVSISTGGKHMWALTKKSARVLYKSDSDDRWHKKGGVYKQIRVNPNGSKVFGLAGRHDLVQKWTIRK